MNARTLAVCGLLIAMPCAPAWTAEKPPAKEIPSSDVYACPMHPDVRAPMARCTQCGMRLLPIDTDGAPRDQQPRHGGFFVQTGNFHVEFVETAAEVQVYLYDAFMQPVPVNDVRGAMMHFLEPRAADYGPAVSLVPNARMGCLIAMKPSNADFKELSAVIPYKDQELQVGCPLRVTVKGSIIDVGCYVADGAAVLDDRECTREGIESGRPAALLVGDPSRPSVYLLTDKVDSDRPRGANERLRTLLDRNVEVSGRMHKRGHMEILEMAEIRPIEGGQGLEADGQVQR